MSLITDSEVLKKAVEGLVNEEFVAVDTEFDRRTTYYPKLCLVQVAGENNAFAIDVLSEGLDLSPLRTLLANDRLIKVFHSSREDIETIYHEYKIMPKPVFDTQVAASILGFGDSVSYASLVETITREYIDKTYRYSDWTFRPLSAQQLDYALFDVTHLRKLYIELAAMLKKAEKIRHADSEMEKLLEIAKYVNDPADSWKRFSQERINPEIFEKIRLISKWREETAQKRDLPRQWVLKDGFIKRIAEISLSEKQGKEDEVRRILTDAKVGKSFIDDIINSFVKNKENV